MIDESGVILLAMVIGVWFMQAFAYWAGYVIGRHQR